MFAETRNRQISIVSVALAGALACAQAAPPAASPAPDPIAEEGPAPLPEVVWTVRPEIGVRENGTAQALPRPLTRLDVQGRGEDGLLRVICAYCDPEASGEVAEEDVIWQADTPAAAATGELAGFAIAVRDAAAWRRIDELVPVMVADFTFGFSAQRDRALAPRAWEWEDFRSLDQVPRLIDEGLVRIGTDFWVAPEMYAERPGYTGLRLGFRRSPESGRWEWLFLVRGEE